MWWFHGGTGWHAAFGGIWSLVSWAVFIGLIVFVVTRLVHRGPAEPQDRGKHDALEVAKLRYARGEITKEEFEEIKRNLTAP